MRWDQNRLGAPSRNRTHLACGVMQRAAAVTERCFSILIERRRAAAKLCLGARLQPTKTLPRGAQHFRVLSMKPDDGAGRRSRPTERADGPI